MNVSPPDAPLPHLVGPPPVPPQNRRSRTAFWFAVAGWGVFALSIWLVVSPKGLSPAAISGVAGVVLFMVSPLLAIAAIVMGFPTLKLALSKAAFILGLLNLMLSAVIIVLGVTD